MAVGCSNKVVDTVGDHPIDNDSVDIHVLPNDYAEQLHKKWLLDNNQP